MMQTYTINTASMGNRTTESICSNPTIAPRVRMPTYACAACGMAASMKPPPHNIPAVIATMNNCAGWLTDKNASAGIADHNSAKTTPWSTTLDAVREETACKG